MLKAKGGPLVTTKVKKTFPGSKDDSPSTNSL